MVQIKDDRVRAALAPIIGSAGDLRLLLARYLEAMNIDGKCKAEDLDFKVEIKPIARTGSFKNVTSETKYISKFEITGCFLNSDGSFKHMPTVCSFPSKTRKYTRDTEPYLDYQGFIKVMADCSDAVFAYKPGDPLDKFEMDRKKHSWKD